MNHPSNLNKKSTAGDAYWAILDYSPDKFAVIGKQYELKYFNSNANKYSFLFGIDELKIGAIFLPLEETNFWKKVFDQALAGNAQEFKKSYLVGENKHTDLINVYPLQNENAEIESIVFQSKNFDVKPYVTKDLLEHQNLFEKLFNSCSFGVTIRDLHSQELKAVNQKICEWLGYTHSELLDLQRSEFVFEEDEQEIKQKMKLLKSGALENFKIEKKYIDKNGNIFWGLATRSIFKIGNHSYQLSMVEDIRKQKEFEAQLIQNEAKLKAIFHHTKDRIFAVDTNFQLIDANHRALEILAHFNLQEKKEKPLLSDFDFSKYTSWKERLSKAFAGEAFNYEGVFEWNGKEQTDLISIFPMKDNDGKIIGATVYGKDITEIKKFQKGMAASEARLKEAERLAKSGYWEIDMTTEKIKWSEETFRIYHRPLEIGEPSKKEYLSFTHPDDLPVFVEAIENTLETQTNFDIKSRILTKENRIIYIRIIGEPLVTAGKVSKILGSVQDITKEMEIENALTKSEAKLRAIFNSTDDAIYAVDKNYGLMDYNEAAAQVLPTVIGVEKLEVGLELLSRISQTDYDNWKGFFDKVFMGERLRVEVEYVSENKTNFNAVTISPIQNKLGEIIGAAIHGKDVTDLKNTKKEINDTQIQLKNARELGKIGTWKYDLTKQKVIWSATLTKLLGLSSNEIYSPEQCLEVVHPEDIPDMMEAISESIKTGKQYNHELRIFKKNGKIIYVRGKGIVIYDEDKNPISFEGTLQDVTQFKEIEANIKSTNQIYRELFENVYDAIVVTDQEGRMVDGNPAAEKLLGYPREELSKLLIKDIVYPEDQERSLQYLQKLEKEGFYSNYQGRIIHKDGSIRYVQVNSNAIYKDGKMVGSRDIVRDISQLKAAEEKREQLLAELAKVNQELKDFAYIVSHDLKAPLRAINAITNWLSEDYTDKLDEKGKEQLNLLSNRVNRMHQFINGIFEYTKLGRIKEHREIVNLEETIRDVSLMLNLEENVELKILHKLPEIYGEKIKLGQLFQNLISNALKYNDKEICRIEIDHQELRTHHRFTIKDNGCGIAEKNFEKIFKIFQTLNSKDDIESTGIGLSIVKRIVLLHGGEITVYSKIGESTTFEFTLEK